MRVAGTIPQTARQCSKDALVAVALEVQVEEVQVEEVQWDSWVCFRQIHVAEK